MSANDRLLELYLETGGNIAKMSRKLGVARSTVRRRLSLAGVDTDKPLVGGYVDARVSTPRPLPARGVTRYIVTCAQSCTYVCDDVWRNLMAIKRHYKIPDKNFLVSSVSYNTNAYGKLAVKRGKVKEKQEELWFDKKVEPFLHDEMVDLAPSLTYCGHFNPSPTSSNPLSGLESYTGRNSGIFPHPKMVLASVASGPAEATKFNYTTGVVTQRNLVQKNAGIKAEQYHSYGALLIEVCPDGSWYVRQLLAGQRDMSICDMDIRAHRGRVSTGRRVETIVYGDAHLEEMCDVARELCWGRKGMLDTLRPKYQVLHDVACWGRRSHHNRKNSHVQYAITRAGMDDVTGELAMLGDFLAEIDRPFCQTVSTASNHQAEHMLRHLLENSFKDDPINRRYMLEAELAITDAIDAGDEDFCIFEWGVRKYGNCPESVLFLRAKSKFLTSTSQHEGVDHTQHGHLGLNGARGSNAAYKRAARRITKGHDHTAAITSPDGVYSVGHLTDVRKVKYLKGGLSTWSQGACVEYENGERAIVTFWAGRWHGAMRPIGGK